MRSYIPQGHILSAFVVINNIEHTVLYIAPVLYTLKLYRKHAYMEHHYHANHTPPLPGPVLSETYRSSICTAGRRRSVSSIGLDTLTHVVPYTQVLYICTGAPLLKSTAASILSTTFAAMTEVRNGAKQDRLRYNIMACIEQYHYIYRRHSYDTAVSSSTALYLVPDIIINMYHKWKQMVCRS